MGNAEVLLETRRVWRMWWSGLFSMAALGHLARAFGHAPVTIGAVRIPVWVSWVVVPLAGGAAGWLMRTALEVRHEVSLPPWERIGGCHPKAAAKEEPVQVEKLAHAGHAYCGVYVSTYPFVDEGDEEP